MEPRLLRVLALAAGPLATLAAASPVAAQQAPQQGAPTLAVGDLAPAFQISHWVKGQALEAFEPGKVYVMEFWATWCPPCVSSMPHLSKLQAEYPGITIVGVSDEPVTKVTEFLERPGWPEKTQYTLATDPDNSTQKSYMEAAGQSTIPTAFIVGEDTRIQWIGHPMEIDPVLAQVVAGTWDVARYQKEQEILAQLQEVYEAFMSAPEGEKEKPLRQAVDLMDQLIASDPDRYAGYYLAKIDLLGSLLGDKEAALVALEQAMKATWSNAEMLGHLASMLLERSEQLGFDGSHARKAAERACELTEEKDPRSLATLAQVLFQEGDYAGAVQWQENAVAAAEGDAKAAFEAALRTYQRKLSDA